MNNIMDILNSKTEIILPDKSDNLSENLEIKNQNSSPEKGSIQQNLSVDITRK